MSGNKTENWKQWLNIRSIERLFLRKNVEKWLPGISDGTSGIMDDYSQPAKDIFSETCKNSFETLQLPSFSATNSLVCDVDDQHIHGTINPWSSKFIQCYIYRLSYCKTYWSMGL